MFKPLIAALTVLVVSFVIVLVRLSGPGVAVDVHAALTVLRHSWYFWLAEVVVVGLVTYQVQKKSPA